MKNLSVETKLKKGEQGNQQKARPLSIKLHDSVASKRKRLIYNGYSERGT